MQPRAQESAGSALASESASDDKGPMTAREKKGEESAPVWTRLLRPDTLQCGSILTRFARAVWLHAPLTSDPALFWSGLRRQVAGFDGNEGWWPHVFWQELCGQWCQSMVVIAPTMTHQTVLLHRHIRPGQDFLEACAASLTPLHWSGVHFLLAALFAAFCAALRRFSRRCRSHFMSTGSRRRGSLSRTACQRSS